MTLLGPALMASTATALDLAQVVPAALLLSGSVIALVLAYVEAWRFWRAGNGWSGPALVAATVTALILRWFVAPWLIATVFMGYRWTQLCIDLFPVSHYGVGVQAFYHFLLWTLPHDHRSLLGVNAVLGVATLPFAATVAARALASRSVGVVTAWLVALAPIFIRNDTSDANNVPVLWWLFGGLVLWFSYLERDRATVLAGAVILLCLSAVSRPEMLGLAPLFVVLLSGASGPLAPLLKRPAIWAAAAAAVVLTSLHALFILSSINALQGRSSLPGLSVGRIAELPYVVQHTCAITDFGVFPVSYTVLALAAFALDPSRLRRHLALGACVILSIVAYLPDLDYANFARVHVPAALFCTFLAASGVVSVGRRFPHRRALLLLAFATVAPLPYTWRWLYRPTNEAQEERFIVKAIENLPPSEPFILVTYGYDDRSTLNENDRFTHQHFPSYQVTPPARNGRVLSMTEFLTRPDWQGQAYFFHGMRCYASFRPVSEAPPQGDNLRRTCALMRETFVLEPVWEGDVPNYGDVWINYYGNAPTFRVGLYKIVKARAERTERRPSATDPSREGDHEPAGACPSACSEDPRAA